MSFWSSQRLEVNLPRILQGAVDRNVVDCNAITMKVGREVYITPGVEHPNPNSHTKKTLGEDEAFAIPPGQFAFLVTEEVVSIPADTMGLISIKATYKLKGLVNVSGFHVDPGWSGQLIFSVFNAGPAPVHLQRGMPLFLLWIADLDEPSAKKKTTTGQAGIPPAIINNITGTVGSISALEKLINEELEKLHNKHDELIKRMHAIDKRQIRITVGLSILAAIFMAFIGVAARNLAAPLLDKWMSNPAPASQMGVKPTAMTPAREPVRVRVDECALNRFVAPAPPNRRPSRTL